MAYCVMCGVKLEDGAVQCPLCRTEVLLPSHVVEKPAEPLFPHPLPEKGTGGISKTSKGIIELILSLLVVSEVTIALTMWYSGNFSHSFIPLFSTAMAALVIAMALVSRHSYVAQTTTHLILVSLYLLGIDGSSGPLSWSVIAVGGIAILWLYAVYTTTRTARTCPLGSASLLMLATLGYLAMINLVVVGKLSWFFPVALPTSLVLFAGVGLFFLLFLTRKRTRLPLADLIFFNLIVLFLTFTALDLFLNRYGSGIWTLSWSVSLFSASVALMLLLISVSVSRRIRRFFTSQNRHS